MQFLKLALRWLPFRPFRRWPSFLGLTKLSCWLLKPFKATSIQHQSLISFTIVGCRTPVSVFGRYRLISDAHVRQQRFLTCSWNINEPIWKMHEMVHCLVAKTVTNVLSGNSRSSWSFFFSCPRAPLFFSRLLWALLLYKYGYGQISMACFYFINLSSFHVAVHEGLWRSFCRWRYRSLPSEDVRLGKGDYWSLADFAQAWYVFRGDIVEMVQ